MYISVDLNKLAKEVAEKALDEIAYEGKTIREWAEIIVKQPSETIHGCTYGGVSWGGTYEPQQPCEDCISRQAVLDTIGNVPDHNDGMVFEALSHAQRDVALLPPVIPKRPKGKWIDDCGGVKCSRCGYRIDDDYYAKAYCPNCGAEMSGGEEADD